MKKLLLFLSFLASQLFAEQCTEQEYKPFFVKNSDRYIYSGTSLFGDQVFDKNSIIYDKENQKIVLNHMAINKINPKLGKLVKCPQCSGFYWGIIIQFIILIHQRNSFIFYFTDLFY